TTPQRRTGPTKFGGLDPLLACLARAAGRLDRWPAQRQRTGTGLVLAAAGHLVLCQQGDPRRRLRFAGCPGVLAVAALGRPHRALARPGRARRGDGVPPAVRSRADRPARRRRARRPGRAARPVGGAGPAPAQGPGLIACASALMAPSAAAGVSLAVL